MKRILVLLFVILCIQFFVFLACKKGSGILAPCYVMPTPTPTFTPDVNYTVYIHQQNTPVQELKITLKSENTSLQSTTDDKGICRFKVNEYGKWILMIDTFDDFSPQSFFVEPVSNTFFAIDYGIPSLELNLVSGSEQIPVAPSSITYTVKYHTKFERKKYILLNSLGEIKINIPYPQYVANNGDELTIRLDIKKSFEGYMRDKKYLDIYAYTQGTSSSTSSGQSFTQLIESMFNGSINQIFNPFFTPTPNQTYIKASEKKITKSNTRTLTKNWHFNITADYYFFTLFAFDMDDGKTCYYAGIKNADVSKSYNIPFHGVLKYEIKEFGTYSSGNNTTIYSGLREPKIHDFIHYGCCNNFKYGEFLALAKIKTNKDETWAWRDGMGANGYIKVRFYDEKDFDVIRRFETQKGWSKIYYQWCCTRTQEGSISRDSCTCKNDVSEDSCKLGFYFRCSDITRYKYERINITE